MYGLSFALIFASIGGFCQKLCHLSLCLNLFYDSDSGGIEINGVRIKDANPYDFRERIGLVSQDPVIFSTSALENIRYGKPDASNEEVRAAASSAMAIEFIEEVGLDYIARREAELLAYATKKLKELGGIQFVGEAKKKAAVISFLVDGIHPSDLGSVLDKLGIAVRTGHHCAQPLLERLNITGTVRASLYFYNSKQEVEDFVKQLSDILERFA